MYLTIILGGYDHPWCESWKTNSWWDEWCTGTNKNTIPDGNYFGENENGEALTLPQACPTTCEAGELSMYAYNS